MHKDFLYDGGISTVIQVGLDIILLARERIIKNKNILLPGQQCQDGDRRHLHLLVLAAGEGDEVGDEDRQVRLQSQDLHVLTEKRYGNSTPRDILNEKVTDNDRDLSQVSNSFKLSIKKEEKRIARVQKRGKMMECKCLTSNFKISKPIQVIIC